MPPSDSRPASDPPGEPAGTAPGAAGSPDAAGSAHAAGLAAWRAGRLDEAEGHLARAGRQRPGDPRVALDRARVLRALGRLDDAETLLRGVLGRDPQSIEGWIVLGFVEEARGRLSPAIDAYAAALAVEPGAAVARRMIAPLLLRAGRHEAAVEQFDWLAETGTMDAELARGRAEALLALGRVDEAGDVAAAALRRWPDDPALIGAAARIERRAGRLEAAVRLAGRRVGLTPDDADAHRQLALALQAAAAPGTTDHGDAALAAWRRAAALAPRSGLAQSELGAALGEAGDWPAALALHRRASRLEPASAIVWCNLGAALAALDDDVGATRAWETALAVDPASPEALTNLAAARRDAGDLAGALALLDRAVALRPDFALARWNRGLARLRAGDFAGGFADYEARWQVRTFTSPRPRHAAAEWAGERLSGILLVETEQGLGDTIQFARFLPLAAARAERLVVRASPTLVRLLADPRWSVIPRDATAPPFDAWVPIMSLARVLGISLATLPAAVPYLALPEPAVADAPGLRRVGLVWAGNPRHSRDRRRSISLAELAVLFDLPGIAWHALQLGPAAAELARHAGRVTDHAGSLADMAETAGIVAGLDLVISVDTAVAHLAGALGRPVWTLLPFAADWRWLDGRDDSPWYPTMRLFRQTRPGDWAGVVGRVAHALAESEGTGGR